MITAFPDTEQAVESAKIMDKKCEDRGKNYAGIGDPVNRWLKCYLGETAFGNLLRDRGKWFEYFPPTPTDQPCSWDYRVNWINGSRKTIDVKASAWKGFYLEEKRLAEHRADIYVSAHLLGFKDDWTHCWCSCVNTDEEHYCRRCNNGDRWVDGFKLETVEFRGWLTREEVDSIQVEITDLMGVKFRHGSSSKSLHPMEDLLNRIKA